MFEAMNFIHYLKYMGIGMLGVFMIVSVIMAATYAIGYFTAPKQEEQNTKLQ